MTEEEVVKLYLKYLEEANIDKVIDLFEKDGIVTSPLYGTKKASDFYKELSNDTANSKLILNGIFSKENKDIALYFTYNWTLKSGKKIIFDVVDIIEFGITNKIKKLTIIYDTVMARKLVKEL